jgi:hypothetical protein
MDPASDVAVIEEEHMEQALGGFEKVGRELELI